MSSSPTERPTLVDVIMPQLGTSITEGTLIAWRKSVGDAVAAEETLCEVSTDKVDTECPAPVSGLLTEVLVDVDETVDVGTVIARIEAGPSSGEPDLAAESPAPPEFAGADGQPDSRPPASRKTGAGRRVSPVVARIAADHDLDLARITGTGTGGRVTKRDALAAAEAGAAGPALHSDSPYRPETPPAAKPAGAPGSAGGPAPEDLGGVTEPLSRIRREIGAAMLNSSRNTATCHTVVECDAGRVEARRRQLGLTALPIVSRAVIDTLTDFPDLNATLEDETITRFRRVHLGIAVSRGDDGLIVPVIHDAQELTTEQLAAEIKELAARVRDRQLKPDDVRGATFTITNPGAFGAVFATPVIDVPQVGILDLEAIVRRPVVVDPGDGSEAIAIRSMVNLILGWDHRALDGVYAARFLAALRGRLEAL